MSTHRVSSLGEHAKPPFLVDVSHRAKLCAPDLGLLDIAERSGLPFSVIRRGPTP
jgi:hypothetical protein